MGAAASKLFDDSDDKDGGKLSFLVTEGKYVLMVLYS